MSKQPETEGTKKAKEEFGEVPLEQEEIGKTQTKQTTPKKQQIEGLFKQKYTDKYGRSKHYLKVNGMKQEESTDPKTGLKIMIYSNDGTECSYYENLSKIDLEAFKLF
jgi:hypothetical protein